MKKFYKKVAFLVGLLFTFVNYHLDEAVVMLSFPPSIFGSRILALFATTFVIHVLASIDFGLFFILIRFGSRWCIFATLIDMVISLSQ